MEIYFLEKSTGTFADELLVAGFGRMLAYAFGSIELDQHFDVSSTNHGSYYQLETEFAIDRDYIGSQIRPFYPAPVLRTPYADKRLPADLPGSGAVVVYEEEKEINNLYWEQFKLLEGAEKATFYRGEDVTSLQAYSPHEHWHIFRLINPAALLGHNALMVQWIEICRAGLVGEVVKLVLDLFSQLPNDIETARKTWRKMAKANSWKLVDTTASQFFNPSQGKGINRPQPNGTSLSNLKSFWLIEWLKIIGFYEIGFTRTLQGSKDRKTYVPVFGKMNRSAAKKIFSDFQKTMRFSETAVRSDILTVIRYLKAMLKYHEMNSGGEDEDDLFEGGAPSDFVKGFQVAFYKDLGNAVTTMNVSFLNLPGWLHFDEEIASTDFMASVLTEHEKIVEDLTEKKGEELELLTLYRDFIVADHLDPFFEFTTAYSSYLISKGEKANFPPRKFTTDNLRRLILNKQSNLSDILDSEGFNNIAYAIRQSTVTAQYRKKQNDRRYDVRYGLGRELVRQSQYPEEFMAALSDFLQKYNAENAQVMENRSGPYRRSILDTDIKEIASLIDKYGSDLIAKMLVAFGYARVSRDGEYVETQEGQSSHE